jgi:hypothetical protein
MHPKIFILNILLLASFQLINAQGLSIKKLPFCKSHQSEIAPTVHDSLLYFSSNKNVSWLSKAVDQDNQNFYNLFTIHQRQDSTWTEEEQFMPSYFSQYHTASISFLPDSNEVYFTEVHMKEKRRLQKDTENLFGVFMAKDRNNGYARAKGLPFNSRRSYNTGHPTISKDGRYLFFASDMEGGFGMTDLYVSERKGTEWGPAQNLGAVINTGGRELFPFYHASGKLYFASDSLEGEGGLDIFYTHKTDNGWARPIAMPNGINTPANEFSCYIDASEQLGYFASDRSGDDDLYEFTYIFPIFGPGIKQKENTYTYRFYDRMNGKGDGPLKYVWHFGDGTKAEGDTVIHKYKQPGTYHVQSVLVDTIDNVELFVLNDFYQDVKQKVQVYINVPDEVKVGKLQTLDAQQSNLPGLQPNGFYWELPDGSKQKGETIQYIFRTKGKHIVKCGTICKNDPNKKMCTYKEINVIE